MHRSLIWISLLTLVFAFGCSRDDAKDAKDATKPMAEATQAAAAAAGDVAAKAGTAAGDMAQQAGAAARETAGSVAGNAVEACKSLAEQGAWDRALDVCKKAHEMMPDDLALEHAYQQAMAASK